MTASFKPQRRPSSNATSEGPHLFHTLDALRGVAAIAVMEYHTFRLFGGQIFPRGYLAVDFFFMLSGFVLTFAYQAKLDSGWSAREFLKTRVIRLYPLYLLGLAGGAAFSMLQSRFGRVHLAPSEYLVLILLGALLLPAPPWYAAGAPAAFPLNVPAWSLFYEVVANLFHALLLRRRAWQTVAGLVLVSGVTFAGCAIRLGTMNFGVYRYELVYGLSRVMFSYLMGMLLMLLWRNGGSRVRLPAPLIILVLCAIWMIPEPSSRAVALNLCVVMGVFPVLILAGASARLPSWLAQPGKVLGTASYAIYVLHVPIGESFEQVWMRVLHHRVEADAPWPGLIYMVLTIVLALIIDKLYDVPVRSLLRRRLKRETRPVGVPGAMIHS